jgi:hypothetical protein
MKQLFCGWHVFSKRAQVTMKKRFTYRELTLVVGIVVALIVIFTLWFRQPVQALTRNSDHRTSLFYNIKKSFIHKKVMIEQEINGLAGLLSGRNNPY